MSYFTLSVVDKNFKKFLISFSILMDSELINSLEEHKDTETVTREDYDLLSYYKADYIGTFSKKSLEENGFYTDAISESDCIHTEGLSGEERLYGKLFYHIEGNTWIYSRKLLIFYPEDKSRLEKLETDDKGVKLFGIKESKYNNSFFINLKSVAITMSEQLDKVKSIRKDLKFAEKTRHSLEYMKLSEKEKNNVENSLFGDREYLEEETTKLESIKSLYSLMSNLVDNLYYMHNIGAELMFIVRKKD